MVLFYFLFLYLFLFIDGKYVCTKNTTIYLELNEIVFYESLNYPTLVKAQKFQTCYISFELKDQNQTDYRVLYGFTELKYIEIYDIIFTSFSQYFSSDQNTKYIFPLQDFDDSDYLAQQGFVLFDDGSDNCPLESICNPFVFTDETQVIYFDANAYYNLSNFCQWKFVAPDGYGLKVVFRVFNFLTDILVTNTTDIIINKRNLKLDYPYYNNDDGIQVSVSIVKKQFNYTDITCPAINVDDQTIRWTNVYYPYKGLPNSARCTYNLSIPSNFAVYLNSAKIAWGLETGADILQYYKNKNEIVQISEPTFGKNEVFIFEPNYDGFEKNILFEFKSDGSIHSLGFSLTFKFLKCKCNPFIDCNGYSQGLMDTSSSYCGNLNCNLTMPPCPTNYGYLEISVSTLQNLTQLLDVFKIISNGETVLTIDNSNYELKYFYVYLNTFNTNILEAITQPSSIPFNFGFKYAQFNLPISNHIMLTSNISYIILDLSIQNIHVIEISDIMKSKNISFLIYRSTWNNILFSIFNNQSLSYNLNGGRKCFVNRNPLKCEIKQKQIALFQRIENSNNIYGEFVAVRLSEAVDGCIFSEKVFRIEQQNIVAITNSISTCEIILFSDPGSSYYIKSLWTTATIENVKVYIGLNKTRLYFEFNSFSAKKWQNIGLFSRSYIIEIPKNTAVFLVILGMYDSFKVEFPHKSLITTSDFGTSKYVDRVSPLYSMWQCAYQTGNNTLRFTALYYNMSPTGIFYLQTTDNENPDNINIIKFNKTGDFLTFRNKIIDIYYNYTLVTDEVMLFIEAIKVL